MNKRIVLSMVASIGFVTLWAQKNDPVVIKINGKPISKSEFEYIYHKNSINETADKKSLDDYLTLFINYKLKVEEGKAQKIDTTTAFKKEYSGYQSQLAEPYLQDSASENKLAEKYFNRLTEDFEVSHILIPFTKKQMLPSDTLETYTKALDVWKKVADTSNPISFESAASTYSSDHSGKKPGYLGWVTGNMLVPAFEDAIFSMPVGGITKPVRTNFGYHIIKLHAKRPDPGQYRVAHIMFATNRSMTPSQLDSVKQLADKVYKKVAAGEDYNQLAKDYSSDKYSSEYGGEVGWIVVGGRYPSEWIDAVFALKNVNDFSQPIKTDFGYHIIKLLEKKERDPYTQQKQQLVNFIKNGDHKTELEALKIAKLKTELKEETNQKAFNSLLQLTETKFPGDSAFVVEAQKIHLPLLKIDKATYSTSDFVSFLKPDNQPRSGVISSLLLKDRYNSFLLTKLIEVKAKKLGEKYHDYRNLSNEYFDGILLFDVMNSEVWLKAEKDTAGLTKFFAENKAKYTWNAPKYKGYVVHCKNEATLNEAKAILAQNKGNKDLPKLLTALNDSSFRLRVDIGTWGEGDNGFVDKELYKKGTPKEIKGLPLYVVEARQIDAPEEYTDVKGQIISDYQGKLEKTWIEYLRKKYKVVVDHKVLESIK